MKRPVLIFALLVPLTVASGSRTPDHPGSSRENLQEPPAVETARIATHLETVERELLQADVSHLTRAQRVARRENLRRLREYRLRGVFPHNHDYPGERVPYFVDRHGTLCAMAYLIERSGRADIVERVARTRNNARVRELAEDPELVAWLGQNGLSAEEAGRIQPMYCLTNPDDPWCQEAPSDPPEPDLSGAELALGSSVSLLGAASIVWNVAPGLSDRGGAWGSVLGLGSGVVALTVGVPLLDDGGERRVMGLVESGIGVTAVTLGAVRLLTESSHDAASTGEGPGVGPPGTAAPEPSPGDGLSISPVFAPGQAGTTDVGMQLRF